MSRARLRKPCAGCDGECVERPTEGSVGFGTRRYCSRACASAQLRQDFTERLWRFIAVADDAECWPWQGATIKGGYGVIGRPSSRGTMLAHRAVYLERVGEIPDGYQVDHLCRKTACCNPSHLEAVTQLENLRRQAVAVKVERTHCVHGHAYAEHGRVARSGSRYCRTCNRAGSRRRYLARRAGLSAPTGETP